MQQFTKHQSRPLRPPEPLPKPSLLLIFEQNIRKMTITAPRDLLIPQPYPRMNYESSFSRTQKSMAKRRGNPNWGKPEPIGPVVPTVTSFESITKEFKLPPDQFIRSTRLREWARRNKNSKYIPEALLEAWGFEIESTL
ncbi:MAG: hypothetical protein ABSA85_16420 [Terracidiphilus sp.]|jgi:hypothetical protein